MTLYEEISLPNSLVMQVWDKSRAIADDTTKVELLITIRIAVRQEYFKNSEDAEIVTEIFGPELVYEYTKERTFVADKERDKVFQELLADFKRDTVPYLAKPEFAARFALARYREIQENPYKYRNRKAFKR